jgi:hypothetical protein
MIFLLTKHIALIIFFFIGILNAGESTEASDKHVHYVVQALARMFKAMDEEFGTKE